MSPETQSGGMEPPPRPASSPAPPLSPAEHPLGKPSPGGGGPRLKAGAEGCCTWAGRGQAGGRPPALGREAGAAGGGRSGVESGHGAFSGWPRPGPLSLHEIISGSKSM